MAISRIKHLRNKRELQLKHMRAEIAQFLRAGQSSIAQIRVEHVVREMNFVAAYETLELFCEFVHVRVPMLDNEKGCPSELKEAVASIIFAAPKCSDLPELMQLRNLFAMKYGKDFISSASELRPDSCVNRIIIQKLSIKPPSASLKIKVLKGIAEEFCIEWDSSAEVELHKQHEDLLDGSIPICDKVVKEVPTHEGSLPRGENSGYSAAPSSSIFHEDSAHPNAGNSDSLSDQCRQLNGKSIIEGSKSNVLGKAQIALAVAEKASAAARRAAELVNERVGHQTGSCNM